MGAYTIITPAHNEAATIERTIDSVAGQTVRPARWIIVDDASTDATAEIVRQGASKHDFIRVVRVDRDAGRNFGNKVRAFNRGLQELEDCQYEFVGNLDADISLDARYYETILGEFARNEQLGIAGGMVHTRTKRGFVSQNVMLDSVAGAIQLFRKECFQQLGGYMLLPYGGIDAAAEITARMKGWQVRTSPELKVLEHRRTGSASANPFTARLKEGRRMYSLGYDFIFFAFRCLYRSFEGPMIIGSAAALCGYIASAVKREPVMLPQATVRFLRAEQRAKLRRRVLFAG
jgi:poly-beta-1,6-N-acetyl-D-glucosamine synthase